MSLSATITTALEAVRRLASLDAFWNLIGGFYIRSDDQVTFERMRSRWTSTDAFPAVNIDIVHETTLDKPVGIESNSSITLLLPSSLAETVIAGDLAEALIRGVSEYLYKEVRGSGISSALADNHTALILKAFPIERIMALPQSDRTQAITTDAAGPAGWLQSEAQVITPEKSAILVENRTPLTQAHDHDHEDGEICAEGETPGELLAGNPPPDAGIASPASIAELSQQTSSFIPASTAGSVIGQPGLATQLPLVQHIAVVGAVRNGALQISNSTTVAIQATLGRGLATGESLRYSLDAGTSWIDVPATAISDGTSVLISALVLPVGSSSVQMASFAAGGQSQISRQEVVVDMAAPTAAVSSVFFNEINGELILSGTQFNSLLSKQGNSPINLLSQIDWSKLNWQPSTSGGASISFTATDIETVKLISDQSLLIRLSSAKRSALMATNGYGSANTLTINSGFLRDEAGNSGTQNTLTSTPIILMKAASGSVNTIDGRDGIDLLFASAVTRGVGEIRLHRADGTLIERFDAATSTALHLDGNRLRLDPTWALVGSQTYAITFDSGSLLDGNAVAVPGISDVGLLLVTAGQEIGKVNGAAAMRDQWPGSSSSESIGNHKMLYMPITFLDVDRDPTSERDMHVSDVVDTATFFRANSQGAMPFNADYTPVITLPFTYTWYRQFEAKYGGLGTTANAGKAEALALGFDSSQYDVALIRADLNLKAAVAWANPNTVWLPWGGQWVMSHETAHALGLGHPPAMDVNGVSQGLNTLDVMGVGYGFGAHTNVNYKLSLNWIEAAAAPLNPGPGVYRIHATDQGYRVAGQYYSLRIDLASDALGTNPRYSVEYRKTSGSSLRNSLLVYRNGALIDLNADASLDFTDAGIKIGQTFQLPGTQTYFTVLEKGDGYIDFDYQQGPFPDNVAPQATLSASATTVAKDGQVTFSATAVDANDDALSYLWRFSDGISGSGATFTRVFTQSAATPVTATLTVSDRRGGTSTQVLTINAGAASTGSPQTVGSLPAATTLPLPQVSVQASQPFAVEGGTDAVLKFRRTGADLSQSLTIQLQYGGSAIPPAASAWSLLDSAYPASTGVLRASAVRVADLDPSKLTIKLGGAMIANAAATATVRLDTVQRSSGSLSFWVEAAAENKAVKVQLTDSTSGIVTAVVQAKTMSTTVLDTGLESVNQGGLSTNSGQTFTTATNLQGIDRLESITVRGPQSGALATVLTMKLWENNAAAGTWSPGTLIATSTNSSALANNANVVFNFNGAKLDPNKVYLISFSSGTSDHVAFRPGITNTAGKTISHGSLFSNGATAFSNAYDLNFRVTLNAASSGPGVIDWNTDGNAVTIATAANDLGIGISEAKVEGAANLTDAMTAEAFVPSRDVNNYTGLPSAIVIPVGQSEVSLNLTSINDAVIEPTKTLNVSIASDSSYSLSSQNSTAAITLLDDDTPVVSIEAVDAIAKEGSNDSGLFKLTRTGSLDQALRVYYALGGTALNGGDFARLDGQIDFRAGEASAYLSVVPFDDDLGETDESVLVQLTSFNQTYSIGSAYDATLTLQDNNDLPIVGLRLTTTGAFYQPSVWRINEGQSLAAIFDVTGGDGSVIDVDYTISGSASNGVDYKALSGTIALQTGGSRSAALNIDTILDSLAENNELVELTLKPGARYKLAGQSKATVEIADPLSAAADDDRFQVSGYHFSPIEGSTSLSKEARFFIHREEEGGYQDAAFTREPATITYSLLGTATPGVDYTNGRYLLPDDSPLRDSNGNAITFTPSPAGNSVTLPGDSRGIQVVFDVVDDSLAEGTETMSLRLDTVSGNGPQYRFGRITQADYLLTDNDLNPVQVGFEVASTLTSEQDDPNLRNLLVAVTLNQASSDTVRVGYEAYGGSATGSGADYTLYASPDSSTAGPKGTLVFTPGTTKQWIKVQVAADPINEDSETIKLRLINPIASSLRSGAEQHTITIDPAGNSSGENRYVRFVTSGSTATEGDPTGSTVIVSLDRPAVTPISVVVKAVAADTNASGADYQLVETLNFAAGETSKAVALNITTDGLPEGTERLSLQLISADGALIIGPRRHDVMIHDAGAPLPGSLTATVARGQTAGTILGSVPVTLPAGRSVNSWRILQGNISAAGEATAAFSINAQGQVVLANPAALPLGNYQLSLVVEAEDDVGSRGSSALNITVGDGAAGRPWATDVERVLAPTALGSISIDTTAVTNSGIAATITAGEITRDRTLGLSGTAPAGHLVRVFSGLQLVGSTTAAADHTWSLTTAALSNGAHVLRAEVSDRFGTIGVTAPVSFTVRGTLELDSTFLLSRDPAAGSPATSSSNPVVSVKGISRSDQGVVAYETAAGLLVADGRTGDVQIASRSASSATQAAAVSSSFSAISADGRYVVFSSSQPGGFGNNGVAFSDSNPSPSSPASDLLVFDRNDASLRLLTSRDTATRTTSKQAELVGISSDSRYAVYTTDYAELIGDFTATSKPAASWTLVDGGYPTTAGKTKTTGVRVADLDPSKLVLKLNGSSVVSKDQLGVVRTDTIQRSSGRLQFWVETSVDTLPKAVKVEITDSDSGLVVKTLESKSPEVYISSGNANNQGNLSRTGGVGQTFTTGSLGSSNLLKTISIDGPNTSAAATVYTLKVWENNGPITTFAPGNLVATSTNSLAFANGYAKSVFQFNGEQLSSNKVYAFSLTTGATDHSLVRAGVIDNGTATGQLFSGLASTFDLAFSIKLEPPTASAGSVDWDSQGNSIPVATGSSAAGAGLSSLSVEGSNVSTLMFDESGQSASRDLIAYNLSTGERRLLSHAATAGDKNSAAAAVSDVTLSADGSTTLFSVLDASKLGNNGTAFIDANPSVKDWLAADLATGQLRLLSSKPANPIESAGVAMSLAGTSQDGAIAVFSVLDASTFGFTDSAPTVADLIAINLATGSRQLISRASAGASNTSAGQTASLELIQGQYVYFRANDATAFGFSADADPTGQDLFRFNLQTGDLQLVSHATGSSTTALSGAYQTGKLAVSPDGRYVYFAHTLKTGGGFTVSVSGTAQMIADMETGAIRLLNSNNSGGTVLGTGAWSTAVKQQFTSDSQSLVWQTSYISFQSHGTSSDVGVDQYTPAIFKLDLRNGVKPTGESQPGQLLSHSPLGKDVVAEGGNSAFLFLGLSSDDRLAYFRTANAGKYGNDGVAFSDASPSTHDVLAVDLQTRQISLLTGDSLTSFAKNATFLSTTDGGAVLLSMADVAGLRTPAGQLSDPNGASGLDLLALRSNLLALTTSSGSANAPVPRQFQLNSRVVPGLDVQLLQDGQVVARQTADAKGQLLWNLSNVSPGSHTYTLRYPGEAILVDGGDPLVASALNLTVSSSGGNQLPTGTVTITGTPTQGQTLTAANSLADLDGIPTSGSGAIAYQWKADGTAISGATGSTLVLTQAQVGKAITVTASYTDNGGTAEAVTSAATAAVANINDSPTGTVTITGTPTQGQTLTAAISLADLDGIPTSGSGAIAYQWKADGTAITGATDSTFVLTQAEVGKAISVTASYTDNSGNAESATSAATTAVANINDIPTGTVTISGTPTQGQTLTAANTLADLDGIPSSGSGAIAYQWKADGTAITGATGSTFVLTQAEVGKAITVTASYTDNGGNAEAVTSAATEAVANINDAPTGAITITGTASQGQTLGISNSLADADGLGSFSYQWKADNTNITGATGSSLLLTQAEVGKAISVTASYTDNGGNPESVTSAATTAVANINDIPTGTVTISGTPTQGQTLTALNTLADLDGIPSSGSGAIAYQWQADGTAITGATDSTFVLTQAEVGKAISVTASYTDNSGNAESVTSAATTAVANSTDISAPVLNGGLTAVEVDADLVLSFSEPIRRGSSGQINLYRGDGTLIESFTAASSDRLLIAGNTMTINPKWDLDGSSGYSIAIDPGSITDIAGNSFAGVSEASTLSFRTGVETSFSLGDSFMRDEFPGTSSLSIGDHRALYMRVTYTDVNRASTTLMDAGIDMENTAIGFIETSKGRMPLTVTYTPVLTLPFSHEWMMTFDAATNGLGLIQDAARAEATKLGFNMADYNMFIVRVDESLRSGSSWGGGGSVWLGWGGEGVILHEGGHALGLGHARSIDWNGNEVEYGNYLDQMGGGGGRAAQFGANTQLNLGWLDSSNSSDKIANPGPGTYRIYALDAGRKEVGRSYALSQKVPSDVLGSNPVYTLEYRARYGGTLARSAVLLRNDQIIDLTPSTGSQLDAGIQDGQTVQIPGSNSYFSVVNVGDGFIDVAYEEGTFVNNVAPTISLTSSATTVQRFDVVTFTADAADANGDQLLYVWKFSDGVSGSGKVFSRSFNQSTAQTITATLTVSDKRGGTASLTQSLAVGAASTGSPVTLGSVSSISLAKPRVAIVAADGFAAEGGDTGSFVISRIGSTLDQPLTVPLTYSGTGLDAFNNLPSSVTIAAGESSAILTLTPSDDSLIETNQSLLATLVVGESYDISSQNSSATFTIADNDTPVVTIEALDANASEPNGRGRDTGLFLISRSGPTDTAMTVYYGLTGTASNGSDFSRLDGQTLIPAGQSSVAVMVNAIDDAQGELTETVTLTLASFGNTYSVGPASSATISIRDSEDRPTVSVRATASDPVEGSNGSFTLTVVGSSEAFTVNYAIGGSASNGSDYVSLTGSVTIPAGSGSRTITIPVQTLVDGINENDESVTFRILDSSAYTVSPDRSAQLHIGDAINTNTGGDRVRVSRHIANSAALADPSENGQKVVEFYLYRDNTTTQKSQLTVSFSLSGTATPGVDYTGVLLNTAGTQIGTFTPAATNTVTIPADASGVLVRLVPTTDNQFEGTETINLKLESVSGSQSFYPLGINREVSVNLQDMESSSLQVGFAGASSLVGEHRDPQGNIRQIQVRLSQASATPVSVQYRPSGGSALGYNSDWTFLDPNQDNAAIMKGTLNFAPGETSQTITIRVNADRIAESQESFGILLENPVGASLKAGASNHTVTLYDVIPDGLIKEERWENTTVFTTDTWDSQPASYTGYLIGLSAAQNVGSNYSRRLSGLITAPSTGAYTFYISGDDDARLYLGTSAAASSRSETAIASVPAGGWTSFQQWNKYSSQQSVPINLVSGQQYYVEVLHKEVGGADHVSVGWSGPSINAITPIVTGPAVLASPDNRYLRFLSEASAVAEGANGEIYVTLDRVNNSSSISVDVQLIAGGSSNLGSDFSLGTTTLTFAPGEISKAITIAALIDNLGEAAEVVKLRLINANGAQILDPSEHQLTITDADAPRITVDTGLVQATDTVGTLIAQANASLASGRSLASWEILSGNPRLEGSSTAAFAINPAGQISLANAAALPLGSYQLSLTLRAIDNLGSSSLSSAKIVVGGQRIVEERWNDNGTAYDDRNWSSTPDYNKVLTAFDAEQDVADDYSRRITGVFTVPSTGLYSFWVSARDAGRLTLAPFAEPNLEKDLASSSETDYQSWDSHDSQQSPPQQLVAGQRYILRAYQKEDFWGDHLSVAWSGPGFSRRLMTASDFLPAQASRVIQAAAPNADHPASVAIYSLSGTAVTDSGTQASISSGSFTRDPSLGLSGTAVAGATITIYEGSTVVGETTATTSGTWTLTTPALADGPHTFRAEVVDAFGNVGLTKPETFTIRSQITVAGELLISSAPGSSSSLSTAGKGLGSIKGISRADQGVVVYDLPTGSAFEEQRWAGQAIYTNNTWDAVAPTSSSSLTTLSAPQDVGNDYSRRIRGTITAPVTGSYTFYLASDDNARLYLSSNDSVANKSQIASVSGWTDFQQWNKYSSQVSGSIALTAGQSYYIEVQHQEGGGGDHVSVGWTGPGISSITPISISSNLYGADAASGSVQLVNRSASDSTIAGSSAVSYAGVSANGRYVIYGTNAVSSFGNNGSNFTDTSSQTASPYSDLIAFDRHTGTSQLITAGSSASTSRSKQAQLIGISADHQFAVFTTGYAEAIGNFTTPGKTAPTSWLLLDGGYPTSAGKLKITSLRVADIDPTKLSFALAGGYITNDGIAATVSSGAGITRSADQLSFWIQALDDGTTKAVKLELQDAADGILVKATAAKYTSGNQQNFNWNTSGNNGSLATSLSANGYGVSLLEAQGSHLTEQMRSEGVVAATDVVATNLVTGEQLLLSHSAAAGHLQSLAANVSQVSLSASGRYVLYAASDASKLGNNGTAFSDSSPAVADLFAADLETGQIRLLSHSVSDPNASVGTAVSLRGTSGDGAYAVFSVNDASAFGFSDAAPGSSDLISVSLSDGSYRLISRASAEASGSSSAQAISFEQIHGNHVYFSATDATKLGFSSDANTSKADLFRYNLATGVLELISHATTNTNQALGASYYAGSLTASPDGRYVAFAVDLQSSSGNFTAGVAGPALLLADMQTGNIRMLNSGNSEGTNLSYGAWGAIQNKPRFFTPDSKALVWQSSYLGWVSTDAVGYGGGADSESTVALLITDLRHGVPAAGQSSTTRVLSHTAASNNQVAPTVTLLGVSEDSRLALFTAADARSFGNGGVAFSDSATSGTDLFAVDLATREIELITGQSLSSFGQAATYLGIGEGGSVIYSLANVAGISTPAGTLSDANGAGTDVMAARFNLIDLVTVDDSRNANGSGTSTDNITTKRSFTLRSWVTPGLVVELKDGDTVVDTQTAGSDGRLRWDLNNVSEGNHVYSLWYPAEGIPIRLASNIGVSTLTVTVAPAASNSAPTGSLTITGTASQGQTLGISNSLADADGLGSFSYQWKADNTNITGATGSSLLLTQAHVGKAISVTASYTDNGGNPESVTSAATTTVANINDSPSGSVTISGTPTQGQTLTAANSLTDLDGIPSSGAGAIAYQWKADGTAISGATGSTLVLTQPEVGKAITVTASYTDNGGTAESVTSTATTAVANINDAPTGTVTISGTPTQGQTLTAANTLADADGIPSSGTGAITYQWKADGTAITGANGSTYLLTQAEVGKAITVTATYTDNGGTAESVTSAATSAVASLSPVSITDIQDDFGIFKRSIPDGGITDDATPTVRFSLTTPLPTGATLRVFRNDVYVGNATGSGTNRSFTSTALTAGLHTFKAAIYTSAGVAGVFSDSRSINLDLTAPTQTVTISAVNDDTDPSQGPVAAGGRTNDSTPTLTGTLSAALAEGETLKLFRGTTFLTDAVVDNTALTWTATPTLSTDGSYAINARVVDAAGNQGPASTSRSLILDRVAPVQTVAITGLSDNLGTITGPIAEGGLTNDTTPTLSGTLSAALGSSEVLTIYRNGVAAGNATVNSTNLTWSYTPATPLDANGTYSFTAAVVDAAGNSGELSAAHSMVLDAPISTAQQDTLTGTSDGDVFLLPQLTWSLLGTTSTPNYDTITGFQSTDRIQLSGRTLNTRLTSSAGVAASLSEADVATRLTTTWAANSARAFTVTGYSGTFLALNDTQAGYQANSDAIVFLQGYSVSSTNSIGLV